LRIRSFAGALCLLGASLAASGCARASAPAGGDVPETPLRVVEAEPEALSVVRPFDGPVRIRFQRRLSERPSSGTLRDGVVVSPRSGSVEVRHRRRGIDIQMEGGFRDATVYRVTLLPVFQDLFQNRLAGPVDLYFSTGPDFEPNVLGGLVMDRLTGEEAGRVRVDARDLSSELVHSTVADSTGIFTFSYLPAGRYRLVAYEDRNRNRAPDFAEPRDSMEVNLSRGDTVIVTELALLPGDSTAPVVQSAVAVDSLTIRVTFDDHLDPADPLTGVTARLLREEVMPGVGAAPQVREILHPHEWEARRAEAEPEDRDQEPADPGLPDPGLPDPEPVEPADPSEPAPPRPGRDLVLVLADPLEPGVTFVVEMAGVANIQGVPGGGGEAEVTLPEPVEEEPPPPDGEPPPGAPPP
jgi:hypothetical protein